MKSGRFISVLCLLSTLVLSVRAQQWSSHFAYNNVTQIAMTPDRVYAVSDGSLFSVDKQSEKIQIYNRQSGLHGTNITCIAYDEVSKTLIIAYEAGRLDMLTPYGVQYIGDLYDKDMMEEKTVYNITIHGRTAYLATHYGVQTFDLRERKLVDSYWLRPNGEVTPIKDILIANDSIYAFSDDSLYCADLHDNIVDYHFWNREPRSSRIQPDSNKGVRYEDASGVWMAGNTEGIVREMMTERATYKPEGPLSNIPYRLHWAQGRLFVLQGGRWANQYFRPGVVMIYDGEHWTNIPKDSISKKVEGPVEDFMNVAVDPGDKNHFFVTSYGTGLYEFRNNTIVKKYLPAEDNTLGAADPNIQRYTRLDGAQYDSQGNLWLLCGGAVQYPLVCLDAEGQWHGIPVKNKNTLLPLHTSTGLVVDHSDANLKWMATARSNTCLALLDDNGTPFDATDDKTIVRNSWTTEEGQEVTVDNIFAMTQSSDGSIWMGTNKGLVIIRSGRNYLYSDLCERPRLVDHNGENPMTSLTVNALCEDKNGNIWVGTNSLGIYVLNSDATAILAQFTTDNSSMPSNTILSLACSDQGVMYIGTAGGLVEFNPNDIPSHAYSFTDESNLNPGAMQQWRLHNSYYNPEKVVATPSRVYALASGALFYADRETDQLVYLSKATGLKGSSIRHIEYDGSTHQLIIAYTDGRINLLSDDDEVRQMPDVHMKAGSIAVGINNISVGKKHSYLAMTFGILAINTKKAEVSDTYYIGEDAKDVDVQFVMENNDSLYAFADGFLYSAALSDNLADYVYWHKTAMPEGTIQNAFVYRQELYMLLQNRIYRYHDYQWQQCMDNFFHWIHASEDQLLGYAEGQGLFRITDDFRIERLNYNYSFNDVVKSQGELWGAEVGWGLIRMGANGDDYFHTEGSNSNSGYFLCAAHDRIYAANGGRWSSEYANPLQLNIFDGQAWKGYNWWDVSSVIGGNIAQDPVRIAVDPKDPGHFFVATYTVGVLEFRNYAAYAHYWSQNSTIKEAREDYNPYLYTRTDGAMIDDKGNFWVLNATYLGYPVHVMTPDGQWHALALQDGNKLLTLITPSGIWTDRRNSKRKWFIDQRSDAGVILMDDNGTPANGNDDKCIKRSTFVDQNGNTLMPAVIRCLEQDHNNRIWIGTQNGIILIPAATDFFTSNACRRIIVPRNDGTGLGDYLLGDEQVNCMAVDGGNRMWIGTANSGLYLIEDDTITVAHFTEDNSLLPSNNVLSLAIMPTTGEVFVGTDKGIASYRSDASEPKENMSGAYAYPNPVRPDYGGMISVTGLMDNSVVNIVDAGGNLVCKTRSHGGTAVWGGKLPDGRRATPGVYTALCNAEGGHAAVKILVVR
ncbi:MAG: hypothetical protein II901_00500 [Paludibacteraceae bacterium]|nr:hypothetical protein [Paludibacteraceae bacterium]